jgi:hypothetical protein
VFSDSNSSDSDYTDSDQGDVPCIDLDPEDQFGNVRERREEEKEDYFQLFNKQLKCASENFANVRSLARERKPIIVKVGKRSKMRKTANAGGNLVNVSAIDRLKEFFGRTFQKHQRGTVL